MRMREEALGGRVTTPYYSDEAVTIYHGDARDIMPTLPKVDLVLTDPPYPNTSGHFLEGIEMARDVLSRCRGPVMTFWSTVEHPPCPAPLRAIHVWHRTNVNGRIVEFCYEFGEGGRKRDELIAGPAIFDGAGPGANEYLGHPTQKPRHVMRRLIEIAGSHETILDPFMGSGTTLRACKDLGRKAIGIEIEERYCEIAAKRMSQLAMAL